MKYLLSDQVIFVTGGAGLLGSTFIESIANSGGTAIIGDINDDAALQIKEKLNSPDMTGKIDYVNINITDKNSILNSIKWISNKYGKIDALVNNAYPRNAHYGRPLMDVEYEDFCENINANLGGYFLMSQQFVQFFIKQGYGNIVNIASIYGVVAPKFDIYQNTSMTTPVEYVVIKSGLIHLTKYFATLLKSKNIRINSLSPGGIIDKQPEIFIQQYHKQCINKGMLNPHDITGSLLYLLSDMSQYVNGQNLIVDDGFTL